MTKIDRGKIVRAVVGSARLEGYKGSLKETTTKKAEVSRTEAKPKATDPLAFHQTIQQAGYSSSSTRIVPMGWSRIWLLLRRRPIPVAS
jgi:hypothetical protein